MKEAQRHHFTSYLSGVEIKDDFSTCEGDWIFVIGVHVVMGCFCPNFTGFGGEIYEGPVTVQQPLTRPAAHMLLIKRSALTPLALYN